MLYVYEVATSEVVEKVTGGTREARMDYASEHYDANDYGWTSTPALGMADGLIDTGEAKRTDLGDVEEVRYRIHGAHPDTNGYSLGTGNDLLFGGLQGDEDGYSKEFATEAEALGAVSKLLATGDWDGEKPVYTVEPVN